MSSRLRKSSRNPRKPSRKREVEQAEKRKAQTRRDYLTGRGGKAGT
jgi:hypothetical protein